MTVWSHTLKYLQHFHAHQHVNASLNTTFSLIQLTWADHRESFLPVFQNNTIKHILDMQLGWTFTPTVKYKWFLKVSSPLVAVLIVVTNVQFCKSRKHDFIMHQKHYNLFLINNVLNQTNYFFPKLMMEVAEEWAISLQKKKSLLRVSHASIGYWHGGQWQCCSGYFLIPFSSVSVLNSRWQTNVQALFVWRQSIKMSFAKSSDIWIQIVENKSQIFRGVLFSFVQLSSIFTIYHLKVRRDRTHCPKFFLKDSLFQSNPTTHICTCNPLMINTDMTPPSIKSIVTRQCTAHSFSFSSSTHIHTSWIVSMGGGGSLWRHRLTMTQVTLRRKVMGMEGLMKESRGLTTPKLIT